MRLSGDAVLPEVRGLRGPLSCLNEARYGIVWAALGVARSSLDTARRYAMEREHLGRRKDAGTLRPEQVSVGKLNNVREALEICRTARTILGANGISLEYPVIRQPRRPPVVAAGR